MALRSNVAHYNTFSLPSRRKLRAESSNAIFILQELTPQKFRF
jgi:hypothetical protein